MPSDDFGFPSATVAKTGGDAYAGEVTLFSRPRDSRRAESASAAGRGRPNGTIVLPRVDAGSVGALMMTFMAATAAMGELLDVNAYDQPGVEDGKKAMYALLGRKGYRVPGLKAGRGSRR